MKAIRTFYKGPGNVRGARMHATDDDGNRIHIPYNYGCDNERRHGEAATALCKKMNWVGELVGGHLGNEMVWVWLDKSSLTPRVVIKKEKA